MPCRAEHILHARVSTDVHLLSLRIVAAALTLATLIAPLSHTRVAQDLGTGLADRPKHVSYTVLATKGVAPFTSTVTFTTRYSAVAQLAEILPLPASISAMLPKRHWFGDHFAEDFVRARKAGLERFLQAICNHPVRNTRVCTPHPTRNRMRCTGSIIAVRSLALLDHRESWVEAPLSEALLPPTPPPPILPLPPMAQSPRQPSPSPSPSPAVSDNLFLHHLDPTAQVLRFSRQLLELMDPTLLAAEERLATEGRTQAALYLRSQARFSFNGDVAQLGWKRPGLIHRITVKDTAAPRVLRLLEWTRLPHEFVKRDGLRLALAALCTMSHPNVAPALIADVVESDTGALLTVRELAPSIRDLIHGTDKGPWLLQAFAAKYMQPPRALAPTVVKLHGEQVSNASTCTALCVGGSNASTCTALCVGGSNAITCTALCVGRVPRTLSTHTFV